MNNQITITLTLNDDIINYVKECGQVDWGKVTEKTDEEHVNDFINTLKITRETNQQVGPLALFGLFIKGSDVVMAHVGTSPRASIRSQTLALLWNALKQAISKRAEIEKLISKPHPKFVTHDHKGPVCSCQMGWVNPDCPVFALKEQINDKRR